MAKKPKKTKPERIEYEIGSENVFADFGYTNPEEAKAKWDLAFLIGSIIKQKNLTQEQAAELIGVDQPKISKITRGILSEFTLERLMRYLVLLGYDVEIKPTPSKATKPSIHVEKAIHPFQTNSEKIYTVFQKQENCVSMRIYRNFNSFSINFDFIKLNESTYALITSLYKRAISHFPSLFSDLKWSNYRYLLAGCGVISLGFLLCKKKPQKKAFQEYVDGSRFDITSKPKTISQGSTMKTEPHTLEAVLKHSKAFQEYVCNHVGVIIEPKKTSYGDAIQTKTETPPLRDAQGCLTLTLRPPPKEFHYWDTGGVITLTPSIKPFEMGKHSIVRSSGSSVLAFRVKIRRYSQQYITTDCPNGVEFTVVFILIMDQDKKWRMSIPVTDDLPLPFKRASVLHQSVGMMAFVKSLMTTGKYDNRKERILFSLV
jgi:predicted XRE-type DNA-binding protein